jgi:hypothetical protein
MAAPGGSVPQFRQPGRKAGTWKPGGAVPRRNRRIITVVCLALAGLLIAVEILGVLSDARQIRGVITVSECYSSSDAPHGRTYGCFGTFVADKGPIGHGIGLDFVNFTSSVSLTSGDKVAARVSGPNDKNATESSESLFRLYLTGGFSILFILVPVSFWYDDRKKRKQRSAAESGQTGPH